MSDYEPMPMSVDDLENFNQLFHVSIEGIETHLTGDQLDVNYVVSTLLALSRQLDIIVYDVGKECRRDAHDAAVMRSIPISFMEDEELAFK